ncbi:MAG: hypothetical protein BWY70_01395 [Bacteroidetes bacterium ADurb.Bin408]|nr:MAG: hypothetical protein BWY70_01395 [Bacteroidetes bacterium ADurb.Bin408]
MKKLLPLITLLSLLWLHISAQNLVPNPSFEDTTGTGCPDGFFQATLPNGWSSYWNTPDYFNSCSPTNGFSSVPNNGWGHQLAATGNAYSGAWAYQTLQPNTREYIGRQLSTSMIIGKKYYANFKVNVAELSNCGINKIGVLFSTVPFTGNSSPAHVINFSQIYSNDIITDTANWTSISGSFVADSSYQYIIIGNFFSDTNTDTILTGPPKTFGYGVYYFIDDIYVGTDSLSNISPDHNQDIINMTLF